MSDLFVLSLISDLSVPVCLVCPMCPGYPVCLVCPVWWPFRPFSPSRSWWPSWRWWPSRQWWIDDYQFCKDVGGCTQGSWRLYTRKLEVVHKEVGSYLTRYALPRRSLRMMNRQSLTHEGRYRAARAAKNVWQKEALSCRSCVVVDHNICGFEVFP